MYFVLLVLSVGLEPTLCFHKQILSLSCLPISPQQLMEGLTYPFVDVISTNTSNASELNACDNIQPLPYILLRIPRNQHKSVVNIVNHPLRYCSTQELAEISYPQVS